MTLRERLIFTHGDFAAGTACEAATSDEIVATLRGRALLTRGLILNGELLVVRLGGRPCIVPAGAVQLVAAGSSEAA